ncbi:MAG TPA: AMP-binding protein, partial [Actinomycetes bacterium]|nr:AMP-binding protein [Actinomycetes bacterium]
MTTARPEHLGEYLTRAAAGRPDHPAFVVGATHLTWAEVDHQAHACAAGLRRAGVREGDRVGLFLGNRPELVIAYYGALRAGAAAVPINPGLTPAEVSAITDDVDLSLVIVDRTTHDVAEHAAPNIPRYLAGVRSGPDSFQALTVEGPDGVGELSGGEGLALVIFTSGTSGRPKGAMLTHRAL